MACATWLGTAYFGPDPEPGPARRLTIEVRAASDQPQDAALARRLGGVLSSTLDRRLGSLHPRRLVITEPAEFRLVVELSAEARSSVATMRLEAGERDRRTLDRWRGRVRATTDAALVEAAAERTERALARELLAGDVAAQRKVASQRQVATE